MIIQYPVFNPATGSYTNASTVEEALLIKEQIKQDYLKFQKVGQVTFDTSFQEEDFAIANEFIAIKEGVSPMEYRYSVYNSTTKQIISRVFITSGYFIKVSNGAVSEWYEIDGKVNGIQHSFVALNTETGEPIEYYDYIDTALHKFSLDGTFIVSTNGCSYDSLSEEMKTAVADFEFKDTIFMYSDKAYGLIFEFNENRPIPYESCTPEQKQILDIVRTDFLTKNDNLFVINKEIIDDQENSTWSLLA